MVRDHDTIDLLRLHFIGQRFDTGSQNHSRHGLVKVAAEPLRKNQEFGRDWFEFVVLVLGYDEDH